MEKLTTDVIKIIAAYLGIPTSQITPEFHLAADLNITTLDIADLIPILEKKFQIVIEEEEAAKFETISDICNFIAENSNEFATV